MFVEFFPANHPKVHPFFNWKCGGKYCGGCYVTVAPFYIISCVKELAGYKLLCQYCFQMVVLEKEKNNYEMTLNRIWNLYSLPNEMSNHIKFYSGEFQYPISGKESLVELAKKYTSIDRSTNSREVMAKRLLFLHDFRLRV